MPDYGKARGCEPHDEAMWAPLPSAWVPLPNLVSCFICKKKKRERERDWQIIFQSGYFFTISQQRRRIPVSPHAHQHLIWSVFLKIAIQMGVAVSHVGFKLYFPKDKLYEHLFMCLLAVCIFSLEKYLSKPLPNFFSFFLMFVLLLSWRVFFLYVVDTSSLLTLWYINIFLIICGLVLYFLIDVFWSTNVFNFDNVQVIICFLLWLCF